MRSNQPTGTTSDCRQAHRLACGLAMLVGWSAPRFETFVERVGGRIDRSWFARKHDWEGETFAFLTGRQREQLQQLHRRGAEPLDERVARWTGEIVLCGDEHYPSGLHELDAPPAALHVVGAIEVLDTPGIAVVGSRKIGVAASSSARRILEPVARRGVPIISGGALGADAVAHRCAVDADGPTVAVLPAGLRRRSPKTNRRLFAEIAEQSGVLISEYPPEQGVRRYHFKRRNSLIAAISRGVLVLRAGENSGTMLTVNAARDLQRPTAAMPGTPEDPLSRGCHDIVRQGGQMIASADDLLQWCQTLMPEHLDTEWADNGGNGDTEEPELPECEVLAVATEIVDAQGAFSMEALARRTDTSAAELQTVLLGHELSGIVERVAGGDRYRLLVRGR